MQLALVFHQFHSVLDQAERRLKMVMRSAGLPPHEDFGDVVEKDE